MWLRSFSCGLGRTLSSDHGPTLRRPQAAPRPRPGEHNQRAPPPLPPRRLIPKAVTSRHQTRRTPLPILCKPCRNDCAKRCLLSAGKRTRHHSNVRRRRALHPLSEKKAGRDDKQVGPKKQSVAKNRKLSGYDRRLFPASSTPFKRQTPPPHPSRSAPQLWKKENGPNSTKQAPALIKKDPPPTKKSRNPSSKRQGKINVVPNAPHTTTPPPSPHKAQNARKPHLLKHHAPERSKNRPCFQSVLS